MFLAGVLLRGKGGGGGVVAFGGATACSGEVFMTVHASFK